MCVLLPHGDAPPLDRLKRVLGFAPSWIEKLYSLVQDKLRGSSLTATPFFDRKKVHSLLDNLGTMDDGARVAYNPIIMTALSLCVLQERFKLSA